MHAMSLQVLTQKKAIGKYIIYLLEVFKLVRLTDENNSIKKLKIHDFLQNYKHIFSQYNTIYSKLLYKF